MTAYHVLANYHVKCSSLQCSPLVDCFMAHYITRFYMARMLAKIPGSHMVRFRKAARGEANRDPF